MNEMTFKFSSNDVGIDFDDFINNSQINPDFKRLFKDVKLQIIESKNKDNNNIITKRLVTIDNFVGMLEKSGWNIPKKDLKPEYKNVNPEKYVDYIFESKNKKNKLHLFFPREYNIPNYKIFYDSALSKLVFLSQNAEIINNNVNSIEGNVVEKKSNKVKKYTPTIKKLLKTKKGKIALCTILGFSIVAGSFIAYTVADRIETQKYLDQQNQYSYQQSQSAEEINRQIQQYQATKNNNLDNSLDSQNNDLEQMKMEYNQENYQDEQNIQNVR